ncbi:hypothetical protein [Acetobacter nitrogenifigens]|uniref:hypothetical protein n=1 Tax=Acetobacter nitrogenifigens TaxID=285268 RepID=UPI001FEF0C28|nr:hypothetical protein [Acetobacter nitrogenifigens]
MTARNSDRPMTAIGENAALSGVWLADIQSPKGRTDPIDPSGSSVNVTASNRLDTSTGRAAMLLPSSQNANPHRVDPTIITAITAERSYASVNGCAIETRTAKVEQDIPKASKHPAKMTFLMLRRWQR